MAANHKLALSVDVDEWFHSRRWVDGPLTSVPDMAVLFERLYGQPTPIGEVIGPTRTLLDLFERYGCRCTFFVLGEVAGWYPELVAEIASRGHEVACHGMHHVDMTVLGPRQFAQQLGETVHVLEEITGRRPVGFRAPNLVYQPWATRVLEDLGFLYDSTVCTSRPIGGKYKGWAQAPSCPYHPSYEAIGRPGDARLVEVPIPAVPILKLAAGSGILTRIIGYNWTLCALRSAIRRGNTAYYFHPWEVGQRPRPDGHPLRNRLFLRRTGPWMLDRVERIIRCFDGRIITARESAESLTREVAAV